MENLDTIENPYKNVVLFPKQKKDTPPLSLENIIERIAENQAETINSISTEIAQNVFIELNNLGYDFLSSDESVAFDMLLVIEAIKSLQYKLSGKEYPMQTILEDIFKIDDKKSFIEFFFMDNNEYVE